MEISETSSLSSYTACDCYLCQYGINCGDIQVEPYPLYAAARQPLVYYAQTPCKNKCRKRPNCFVRAFRWYTNEHNAPDSQQKSDLSCGAGQVLDTCPQDPPPAPDLGAFANWLDTKYEQFLQENACRIKLTQTSVYETCQPLEYSAPCEPTCTRKRYPRAANQMRIRRDCNKRECQRDNPEVEINTVSMEYIMAPKNLSCAVSECCQPVSTPGFPTDAMATKSQSDTVCLNKSGGDYRDETRTVTKTDKPPVEQKRQDLRAKRAQNAQNASCQCAGYSTKTSVKTQYAPVPSPRPEPISTAEKMSEKQQTGSQAISNKPTVSIQCIPCNPTEQNKDTELNKDANLNKNAQIQSIEPCPSFKMPCPSASANAPNPCPSLKTPCPAARKCPSLREPCPVTCPSASSNVCKPSSIGFKEPCPEARKRPSLQEPCLSTCLSASANAPNPCPDLKEPCPAARKCPELREPCPSTCPSVSSNVVKQSSNGLKEPCPEAGKRPSLLEPCQSSEAIPKPCTRLKEPCSESRSSICPGDNENIPKPCPTLKEPCSSTLKPPISRQPCAPLCPDATGNVTVPCPSLNEPCPAARTCPQLRGPCPPTCPNENSILQRENTTLLTKQEEVTVKPFAVNATPTVREANTETGEICVPCRIPYPSLSCAGTCRTCCSIVQSITDTYPSYECHCHGIGMIHRRIEPSQAQFTTIRTSNASQLRPLDGMCSVNCPFFANKTQFQTVVRSQSTATEAQTVTFKTDCTAQTSDCALQLDRSNVFQYPLFMKVVCADKL